MTVRFNSLTDTLPKPCGSDWQSHLAMLGVHLERSNKSSGSLWSPAVYAEGERRGNAGVIGMTCFVADLDGESLEDARERLNEFTYLAYTTYISLFHAVKGLCSVCFMLRKSMAKWFRVFGSNEIESDPDSVFGNDFASEIRHYSEPPNWIDLSEKNNYEALKVDKWLKNIPHDDDEMTDSEWDEQDKLEIEFIEREQKFCELIQRLQKDFPEFMCYVNVPSRYVYGE